MGKKNATEKRREWCILEKKKRQIRFWISAYHMGERENQDIMNPETDNLKPLHSRTEK